MKMKKMIGALALTAALAMGTTPAFAAGTSVGNDQLFAQIGNAADNMAQGSTVVNGQAINAQLIVTVPIELTVVVPTVGGDLICPSSTAYRIQNQSNNSVFVIGAQINNENQWLAVEDAKASANDYSTTHKRAISLKANGLNLGHKTINDTAMKTEGAAPWEIMGGSAATPTNYPITLEGYTNDFTAAPLTSGTSTGAMCKIVYTITNQSGASAI